MAGLLGTTVVAIGAPLAVYTFPAPAKESKSLLKILLGRVVDEIREGEAIRFDSPAQFGFVMADGGGVNSAGDLTFGGYIARSRGKLHVLGLTCPHLGCYYATATPATHFLCPCHGSQFDFAGNVIHGPANSPLSHLTWQPSDEPDAILIEGQPA